MPSNSSTNLPTISTTAPQTEPNSTTTNSRRLSSYLQNLRNHLRSLRTNICSLSTLLRRTAVPQVSAKEYYEHWYSLWMLGHSCLVTTAIFGFSKISLTNHSPNPDKLTPRTTLNIITTSLLASFLAMACLAHTSYEIRRCYCLHFLHLSTPNFASFIMFAWGCMDMWFVGVMGWVAWEHGFVLPWWGYLLVTGVVYAWCAVVWVDRNWARAERRRLRNRRLGVVDVDEVSRGRDVGWRTGRRWWM